MTINKEKRKEIQKGLGPNKEVSVMLKISENIIQTQITNISSRNKYCSPNSNPYLGDKLNDKKKKYLEYS